MSDLKPFSGELDRAPALKPFDGNLDGESSGVGRRIADVGIDLAKGIIGVPEAGVGIADLATGGQAGKALEGFGVKFKQAKDFLSEGYSPERQAAQANVQAADGFLPTLGAMIQNPSTIVGSAVESAPSMIGGAGVARGLLGVGARGVAAGAMGPALPGALVRAAGAEAAPIIAGAAGEGAVAAGQNTEQVRQEDPNGTLTPQQSAILAASGVITGGIGYGAGKLANRLGIGEVNTMLAGGKLGPVGAEAAAAGAQKSTLRKIAEGAAVEGGLQELPQSWQEQVAQNLAQGKPWDEGAGAAAAQGLLVGGVTGAIAGPLHSDHPEVTIPPPPAAPPAGPIAGALLHLPNAPTMYADAGGTVLSGEQRTRSAQAAGNIGPETGNFGQGRNSEPAAGTDVTTPAAPPPGPLSGSLDHLPPEYVAPPGIAAPPSPILDGDITDAGKPFKGAIPAARAAREAGRGFVVAKIEGGYVVRKAGDENVTDVQPKAPPALPAPQQEAAAATPTSQEAPDAQTQATPAAPAPGAGVPATGSTGNGNVGAGPAPDGKAGVLAPAPDTALSPQGVTDGRPGPAQGAQDAAGSAAQSERGNDRGEPPAVPGGPAGPQPGAGAAGKGVSKAAPAPDATQATAKPLSLGVMPNNADAVTVKNGVIHIGKYPAIHFDTGDDIKAPEGATDTQIKKLLKDGGAVASKLKFFGGNTDTTTAAGTATSEQGTTGDKPGAGTAETPPAAPAPVVTNVTAPAAGSPQTASAPVAGAPAELTKPAKPMPLRDVTADEARALVSGKTEKPGGVDPIKQIDSSEGNSKRMQLGDVPLSDVRANEEGDRYDGTVNAERAKDYAARGNDNVPPVILVRSSKTGALNVLDGGHRVTAARLRGDATVRAIVMERKDATAAEAPAAQPPAVDPKRELIELKKRESVLQSLMACLGG